MDIWNFIRSRRIYVSSIRISFLLLVCVLFIVFLNFSRTSASVTLIYFRALPENGAVYLEWETATEIDSAGFYVTRSASESSGYERIGSFIPSRGDFVAGAYYDFRDSAVENGDTYFYILESWNYDNTVDYTDPVSAIPGTEGSTATPTSTPTKIGSPSPTATQTSGETPTITNTLMVSTKTPTPSNTPEETNTSEPTSTNTPVSDSPYSYTNTDWHPNHSRDNPATNKPCSNSGNGPGFSFGNSGASTNHNHCIPNTRNYICSVTKPNSNSNCHPRAGYGYPSGRFQNHRSNRIGLCCRIGMDHACNLDIFYDTTVKHTEMTRYIDPIINNPFLRSLENP